MHMHSICSFLCNAVLLSKNKKKKKEEEKKLESSFMFENAALRKKFLKSAIF